MDISTLFIQICGRIRNSNYNTQVAHFFSETRYNKDVSLAEFIKVSNKQRQEAKEWIEEINAMKEANRKRTINLFEKNKNGGLNEKYIFNNNGMLELDENLMNLDIVNFKINKHLYQSRITLQGEYQRFGFNVSNEINKFYTDELLSNTKAKISFKDLFIEYANLRGQVFYYYPVGNEFDRIRLIEQEKPLIKEAYEKLGNDKVKEMNYHVGNIKRALLNMQTDISTDTKIMRCLKDAGITVGITLPTKKFKNILQNIYTSLEINNSYGKSKTAKATDIDNWFKTNKSCPKIDGKTTDCITITTERIIFV